MWYKCTTAACKINEDIYSPVMNNLALLTTHILCKINTIKQIRESLASVPSFYDHSLEQIQDAKFHIVWILKQATSSWSFGTVPIAVHCKNSYSFTLFCFVVVCIKSDLPIICTVISMAQDKWYDCTSVTTITAGNMSKLVSGMHNTWWRHQMETFSTLLARDRWIPRTKASESELWCLLWSALE